MASTTPEPGAAAGRAPEAGMKFSDILADPRIAERWQKVRKWFFLRESTYDMTHRCNIRCNGCYYYEGDKQFARENRDPEAWRELMRAEKKRGITFVVLAGAEPSLVPELCEVCYQEIPLGAVATNGLAVIPRSVGYRIHVSVWGTDETSLSVRQAKHMLVRQIENYGGDPRAVFVYTFTRENIGEAHAVAETLRAADCRLTFNMFSAPVGYREGLRHTPESLRECRRTMLALLERHPGHVLFSPYSAVAHTHTLGLHDAVRLLVPAHERGCRRRPRPDVPTVPHRPDLGPRRILLRSGHRLRGLPSLRRRQRRGHRAHVPPRHRPGRILRLAGLRGHLPGGVGHGLREGGQPVCRTGRPARVRAGVICTVGARRLRASGRS